MAPGAELVERFRCALDALIPSNARVGLAVSGGPDSLALLFLVAAARPGLAEAATVDHGLRPESRSEAEMVAETCGGLGVPHEILTVEWSDKPDTAIQERARAARYERLAGWVRERGLHALVTAHHLDDQAETLLMRLARGAGVRGLAGMRPLAAVPGSEIPLLRPLLGWRRSELEQVCAASGIAPVDDPSNADERFERVRVRRALAESEWLDPAAVARSAASLADGDRALEWATEAEWTRNVSAAEREILYRPADAPHEIRRRIVARAIAEIGREGDATQLRGAELDRLLSVLRTEGQATLRGVLCSGGAEWRFVPAPHRTRPGRNSR